MNFLAVTTFNAEGLELYGRRMMETFSRFWPTEVELRVYSEGWGGGVDLISASPWLKDFKERHKGRAYRDFRWDAVCFSHKVAAVCAADSSADADVLIWIDGDVTTHGFIQETDLTALAPVGNEWIAWLNRAKMYPECGFYMLNRRHPRHTEMMKSFETMYSEDRLFGLPEFHDSFVLEQVVKQAGVETKSLSGSGVNTSHPLVNGPLSRWLDHAKGPRKIAGRTPRAERKIKDGIAYWQ